MLDCSGEMFKVSVLHVEVDSVLHTYEFEKTSKPYAYALAIKYGEIMLDPNRKVGMLSKALANEVGFEVDFSKGVDNFFEELAKHSSMELLNAYAAEVEYEPHKNAVENELKSRGEI